VDLLFITLCILLSFIKNEATYAKWFPFWEIGIEEAKGSGKFAVACDCFFKRNTSSAGSEKQENKYAVLSM
jgi:hypothetical protein